MLHYRASYNLGVAHASSWDIPIGSYKLIILARSSNAGSAETGVWEPKSCRDLGYSRLGFCLDYADHVDWLTRQETCFTLLPYG